MSRRFLRTSTVWTTALLLGAGGARAVPESLLRNSPFQPEKAAAQVAAPTAGRFELRGLMALDGTTRFTIFDTSNSRAIWLAVGESEGGIKVAAFDAAAEAVTIEFEGQSTRLTMKKPEIVNVAVALPTAGPSVGPQPAANVNPAPPANEKEIQERRNRIIEELRRRRALRQANRNQQPPQQ